MCSTSQPSYRHQEMEHTLFKSFSLLFLVLLLVTVNVLDSVDGAGECGRAPVANMALRMAPCVAASQNVRAPVSPQCCAAVQNLGRNPKCLCAVMLSGTAKSAGVKPAVAMTIPKRCSLWNRPVGYKCGGYTLP